MDNGRQMLGCGKCQFQLMLWKQRICFSPEIFAIKSKPLRGSTHSSSAPSTPWLSPPFYFYFLPLLKTPSLVPSSRSRPTPWQTSNLTVPGEKKAVLTKIDQQKYFLWQCSFHAVLPLLTLPKGWKWTSREFTGESSLTDSTAGITEAASKCKCVSPFFLNSLCSKCGTESQEWGSTPCSDRSSLFGLSL